MAAVIYYIALDGCQKCGMIGGGSNRSEGVGILSSYLSLVGVLLYCYKISNAKIFSPFVKWSSCIILIKKVMSYSFGSVVFTKPIKNCSVKYNKKHRLQIKIFVKYTLNHHT